MRLLVKFDLKHLGKFSKVKYCCNTNELVLVYESWELATALKEAKPRFDAAGVKLIAVGVGTPDKARILATRVIFLHFLRYIYHLTKFMDMFSWDVRYAGLFIGLFP